MSVRREVLDFLLDHKGWVKKSNKDLQQRLYNLGIKTSIDDIRTYQAEARRIIKDSSQESEKDSSKSKNAITDGMQVKKVWFTPQGKMGVSYEAGHKEEIENNVIESIQRIIKKGVIPFGVRASKSKNDKMISIFSTQTAADIVKVRVD